MKFEIKNRFTGSVQFECEISAEVAGLSYGAKLGFAVSEAFRRGAVLRGAVLRGAVLRDADMSGADLRGAVLRGAVLRDADMSGADLRDAVLRDAVLRDAVLRDADMSGADLRDAVLRDADMSGADLRSADLRGADLSGANLSGANLSGACPVKIENIHKAVYAAASQPGALAMESWHHSCGTSHCRAGWVVTLAGDAGKALEWVMGTAAAAALIYMASDPKLERIPDFYCDNEAALEDMRRLAQSA